MVRNHSEFSSEKLIFPVHQSFQDGQQLLFMRPVVALGVCELARVESRRLALLPRGTLAKVGSDSRWRRITHYPNRFWLAQIDRCEEGCVRHDGFDCVEA